MYNAATSKLTNGLTSDAADLPTREEIIQIFGMEEWQWDDRANTAESNVDNEDKHKNSLMQRRLQKIDNSYDLTSPIVEWNLEDVLEVGGCCVHGRSEFNLFAEENQLYEILTLDYVEALTLQIRQLRALSPHQTTFSVCEVGAGSGALTHHIKRCLERTGNREGIEIIATDSGAWNLGKRFAVEPYTNKEALTRFQPDLVLVSWMPAGTDWSASFRRAGVANYIICGEADDGCTGHNWLTWGNPEFREQETDVSISISGQHEKQNKSPLTPLYKRDGYVRQDLVELKKLQLQRYDSAQAPYQSTTVLFSQG